MKVLQGGSLGSRGVRTGTSEHKNDALASSLPVSAKSLIIAV